MPTLLAFREVRVTPDGAVSTTGAMRAGRGCRTGLWRGLLSLSLNAIYCVIAVKNAPFRRGFNGILGTHRVSGVARVFRGPPRLL